MKAIITITILISSALAFLSSCRTGPEPRYSRSDQVARRVAPQSYYRKNAEGSYYYADDPGTNTNFHPGARRNAPLQRLR